MNVIRLKNKSLVIGDSDMEEIVREASRAAGSNYPVLLCGESGTGKELIARLIHEKSGRTNSPFVAVNCAAIPEGLIEAELFGFERGAFTGAMFQRIGKFEMASGGTLLMDEISEMPFPLQAKLLRVLQEQEIDRLGAREPVKINVRIIATSNRSPEQLISEGRFREDLYYRLNVLRINCPSLNGRIKAIQNLAHFFVTDIGRRGDLPRMKISAEAEERLAKHSWPGNVRELENVIERAALRATDGVINAHDLSFEQLRGRPGKKASVGGTLAEIEKDSILGVLESHGGNRTCAAKDLGITVRTLRNKLREYRQE